MSRDYNKICKSVLDANQQLHNGEHLILQDIESIKKDLKNLNKKLDRIYDMIYRMRQGGEFGS